MKSHIDLRPYLSNRVRRLASLVNKPTPSFTMQDIHTLRVDIKQVRTLFQYLNTADNSFPYQKRYKPFRKLFRKAGKLREIQLRLIFMQPYVQEPAMQSFLRDLRQEMEVEFVKCLCVLTTRWKKDLKKAFKSTTSSLKKADLKKARGHLDKKRKQIRSALVSGTLVKKEVHALRWNIKELYYLEKAIKQDNPKSKVADDFQELLGEWHDHVVINADLKKDIRKYKADSILTKRLGQIRKLIQARENDLFLRILKDRKAYLDAITPRT